MSLVKHAEFELRRAGLFDKDSDYGGMLAEAVMKLIETFSAEGHSGFSAEMCTSIFERLSRYRVLTPLTNNPEEWMLVGQNTPDGSVPVFQSTRDSSFFSNDGGKTGYSVDDRERKAVTFADKSCIVDGRYVSPKD